MNKCQVLYSAEIKFSVVKGDNKNHKPEMSIDGIDCLDICTGYEISNIENL